MTRDDIIRMAREAGFTASSFYRWSVHKDDLHCFFYAAYAAGAKAEREKVAQWMIQRSYATGHGDTTRDLLSELEWQIRESECKACIRACEEDAFEDQFDGLGEAVKRIEARGEALRRRHPRKG